MQTEKNILIAFILNFVFSLFEFIGGTLTGSVAIISDAIHDIGDALSIGISCFLETKSKKEPDNIYTYGYTRLSVIGSFITTVILLFGSGIVIYNSVVRIFHPVKINYSGMIIFAIIGVTINFVAAMITNKGESLNQRAVNLHMLEDVLGWLVVLIGSVLMYFTDISVIDSVMSIGVSIFIFINAFKNLIDVKDIFVEKIPSDITVDEIKKHICQIDEVIGVHHIHIWSMDGFNNYATMHVVTDADGHIIKDKIREELREHNIKHVTLELEKSDEHCHEEVCILNHSNNMPHNHHHHH